ncbi:hypothetical protein FQA47_025342 [Oryzias melastigma]|uniref:Uncharacterized protein n=1 Tax=Oryzias melastigma TaxID=30732 RepID=A0A834FRR5_ORYME|nr:hypothetical protein FQA47_025342 [Oryzias melastigma]
MAPREDMVVLSGVQDQSLQKGPASFKLQLCVPLAVDNKDESLSGESPKASKGEEDGEFPKDMSSEEPAVEVQVTTEAEAEPEVDGRQRQLLLGAGQPAVVGSEDHQQQPQQRGPHQRDRGAAAFS